MDSENISDVVYCEPAEIEIVAELEGDIEGEYNVLLEATNNYFEEGLWNEPEPEPEPESNVDPNIVINDSSTKTNDENENQEPTTDTETGTRKRKRKPRTRFAEPHNWAQNVHTASVTAGKPHSSRAGNPIEEKKLKPDDCDCKRYNCRNVITHEQQSSIFQEYRQLDRKAQRSFLSTLLIVNSVQRRTTDDPSVVRKFSVTYMLPNESGDMIRVCQQFFCWTFGISTKVTRNVANRISPSTGRFNPDHGNLGRVPLGRITPERLLAKVNTFINAIPKLPSHYCRKNSTCLFLEPGIDFPKLYELYKKEMGADAVSVDKFRKVFNAWEPRIKFHQPLKDQCTVCNNADGSAEYEAHVQRKEDIREMKANDKRLAATDESLIYGTFDLQAVLVLPYCEDAQAYYKRKMSVYNFTIYDSNADCVCNVFDECNGRKSSTEISSCLYDYLLSLKPTVERVILYCDTCPGQNRNQFVTATLLHAVHTIPSLKTIDLKFMESGHSFMECDSAHSLIERTRKNQTVYSPTEYENIMKRARKSNEKKTPPVVPYIVKRLYFSDFYNIRALTEKIMINRKKDVENNNVDWLKIKWLRFTEDSENIVFFKYDVKSEFLKLDVSRTPRRKCKSDGSEGATNRFVLRKTAYAEQLPISVAKKKDLIDMLNKRIIPQEYAAYYEHLPSSKHVKDEANWVTNRNGEFEEPEIVV
ncbi:uncharacterized protein LOC135845719 isoform X2 [Planococcus citri]|uniref:uncharacterized protein LOC135845719 isoform X2 n=1 Tax=Planococcus citri TaxID=170843 RepID=UPI0031F9A2D6